MSKIQAEVQDLYRKLEKLTRDNTNSIYVLLHENLLARRDDAFIRCLIDEECRRFRHGYTASDKLWPEGPTDDDKFKLSRTVAYFLLSTTNSLPPTVTQDGHQDLVASFLDQCPPDIFNHELLENEHDMGQFYSVVSLVFEQVSDNLERDYSFAYQIIKEPEQLYRRYLSPSAPQCVVEFWINQAFRLLRRGATIDYGYLIGTPIFCQFARFGNTFLPILLKHFTTPNRVGKLDVAPLHSMVLHAIDVTIIKDVIMLGADIEAKCFTGIWSGIKRTALELAVHKRHSSAVECLLEHMANPNNYSDRVYDTSDIIPEQVYTPYQAAVSAKRPETLQHFFAHRDRTGVRLSTAVQKDSTPRIMQRGEATLDITSAAVQIQTRDNLLQKVQQKTGLSAFAEDSATRLALEPALLWLFSDAKKSAAASIWLPIIAAFESEIAANNEFKITALSRSESAACACYNDDTQSDIYVTPNRTATNYRHFLVHEIAHYYSLKYRQSSLEFLQDFRKAMEADGLLDRVSPQYATLPHQLKDLLDDMYDLYNESKYNRELFPRVCVEFPVIYALTHPDVTENDLLELMNTTLPNTFKLYQEMVMNVGFVPHKTI